jgi:general secretion pathway protein J
MLVVLVLTAVIAAMMVGGIRQMQTWTQLEKRQSAQSALEAVADHMSGELAGALSLPLLARDGEDLTPMAGSSDRIRFVAVIRTGFSAKALREVTYATESSATAAATLIRKSQERRLQRKDEILPVQSEELYTGISKVTFGYLTRSTDSRMTWLDSWAKKGKLPLAIRIKIAKIVDGLELNVSRTVSLID